MDHDYTFSPTETWCATTQDTRRYVLDYAGNGGFGPVNVWSNGLLVPVLYRHHLGDNPAHCPVCADPAQANTYLPPITWSTPDPSRTETPGSGHPDRGEFTAVFSGGPDYEFMRANVVRRSWWRHWRDYADLELNPHGTWKDTVDHWRRYVTGYTDGSPSVWPSPATP